MLLRKITQAAGLCNVTRMIVKQLETNTWREQIISEMHMGNMVMEQLQLASLLKSNIMYHKDHK